MDQQRAVEVRWEWILEAWRLFTSAPLTWIMMQVVVVAFVIVTASPIIFLLGGLGVFLSREAWGAVAGLSLIALILVPFLVLVLIAGGAFLVSGFYKTAIRKARGEEISVSDIFSGGESFFSVLWYLVLLVVVMSAVSGTLGSMGGSGGATSVLTSLLASLVNSIVLGMTIYTLPLIVDQRVALFDAIGRSIEMTRTNWLGYAILAFVVEVLSGAGIILCLVGIVLTSHFQWTVPAAAYHNIFDLGGKRRSEPFPAPPPPPDYRAPVVEPEPVSSNPTLGFCMNCGAPLPPMGNFCSKCGSRISGN